MNDLGNFDPVLSLPVEDDLLANHKRSNAVLKMWGWRARRGLPRIPFGRHVEPLNVTLRNPDIAAFFRDVCGDVFKVALSPWQKPGLRRHS